MQITFWMCFYCCWLYYQRLMKYRAAKIELQRKQAPYFQYCVRQPFKSDEKRFLFHLKNSFLSQDIYIFVLSFWSCKKNGLIRKIKIIWKFMTSQPGQQTITIHILSNISRSKGNQTLKYGQVIEYDKRNILLQKSCRKWVGD